MVRPLSRDDEPAADGVLPGENESWIDWIGRIVLNGSEPDDFRTGGPNEPLSLHLEE